MDVEIRPGGSADADLVGRVDPSLPPGETVRDGRELRVGVPDGYGQDALRAAAAAAARAARRDGGRIAWAARDADEVRALVEGTAYGAYDAGIRKRGYGEGAGLTLV